MTDNNGITISNITANAAMWAPDEPATISFKFKNGSGSKILDLKISIILTTKDFTGAASGSDIVLANVVGTEFIMERVNLANGKSKTYSASFAISGAAEQYFEENAGARAVPIYIRYTAADSSGSFAGTFELEGLKALNHRFTPQITEMNLDRAKDGIPNDEGENVLTTLRLGVNTGNYDYTRFMAAKIYTNQGGEATTADSYIDITGSIPSLLSGAVNNPDLIPGTYDKAYDWDFLLAFGDEYEVFYGRFNLGMAFANLHLSGVSTGGACFGGFCTSSYKKPKLESHYPIYAYKGIAKLGEDWTYITPLAGTTPAEFGGGQLRCRKVENKCIVEGSLMVKPGSSTLVLAALPDGYTPEKGVFSINACEGGRVARIVVGGSGEENAGKLCMSWVKNLTDGSNYTAAAIWVQCSIEYWVEAPEDDIVSTANLIDSTGAIVTDVTGREITVRSAGSEPYQSIYTGKQIDDGITAANNAASRTYVDDAISKIELTPGASAYDIAKKNGFVGSEAEWLESLHGKDGDDGYTPVKNKDYFDGTNGKSAYEYAQEGGYAGTEEEFGSDLNNAIHGGGGSGGSAAWKDIDGNPFVLPITGSVEIDGDTLRWDGDTAGMVISTAQNRSVVFISDNVPPFEKVRIGIDVVFYNKNTNVNSFFTLFPELGSKETDKAIMLVVNVGDSGVATAWVVREPGYDSKWGVTFDRPGVYLTLSENGYYKEFTLLNYAWTESKEKIALPIPPIPQDYLPELTELIMVASGGQKYKITINSDGDFVKTQI